MRQMVTSGLRYAGLGGLITDAPRIRAVLDKALAAAQEAGVKPVQWRLGQWAWRSLGCPQALDGLPVKHEGLGWQMILDTSPEMKAHMDAETGTTLRRVK